VRNYDDNSGHYNVHKVVSKPDKRIAGIKYEISLCLFDIGKSIGLFVAPTFNLVTSNKKHSSMKVCVENKYFNQ